MLQATRDNEQIAALDIGKEEVVCCVRVADPVSGGCLQDVTTHRTMTRSLLLMCERFRELGVTRVIMEATSDY